MDVLGEPLNPTIGTIFHTGEIQTVPGQISKRVAGLMFTRGTAITPFEQQLCELVKELADYCDMDIRRRMG